MAARRDKRAVEALLERLRLVTSCVTPQPVQASRHTSEPQRGSISFVPLGRPATLRRERDRVPLLLDLRYDFRVEHAGDENTPVVVPAAYSYRMLDRGDHELLAFHWHPIGLSNVTHPHLHLSSRVRPVPIEPAGATVPLGDMHIPTGFVNLADVIRLLITEFGVEPRRRNWEEILEAAPPAQERARS